MNRMLGRMLTGPGFRPGPARALVGFVVGVVLGVIGLAVLRFLLSMGGFIPGDSALLPSSGAILLICGFSGLAGWLWGLGGFSPYSHEHDGLIHAPQDVEHSLPMVAFNKSAEIIPNIIRAIIPMIKPLLIVLAICVVAVAIFWLFGMTPIMSRVQTDHAEASAVTASGDIMMPIGANGTPVNKTVFFAIVVLVVLGLLAGTAVVLALIFAALNRQVNEVKKEPDSPPETQPALLRLADFFTSWIYDILEATRKSVVR